MVQGDWKLIKYRSGKLELYNLAEDESETNNLAEVEPHRLAEMTQTLTEWQEEATPEYLLP